MNAMLKVKPKEVATMHNKVLYIYFLFIIT